MVLALLLLVNHDFHLQNKLKVNQNHIYNADNYWSCSDLCTKENEVIHFTGFDIRSNCTMKHWTLYYRAGLYTCHRGLSMTNIVLYNYHGWTYSRISLAVRTLKQFGFTNIPFNWCCRRFVTQNIWVSRC